MASLLSRFVASFAAIAPVPNLTGLDGEFNQIEGASGVLNGGTTAFKLLVKTSDATDPPVDQDQIGAGLLARWKQNGTLKASLSNDGSLTASGLTGTIGVYAFSSIPLGPAANPSTDNQLVRKAYVDTRVVAWTRDWFIEDPSTFPTGEGSAQGVWIVPAGTSIVVTKIKVAYYLGSHTAGGAVQFVHIHKNSAGGASAAITDLSLNDTNATIRTTYSANFGAALTEGDQVSLIINSRSGTVTERNVSISLHGTQRPT
jgi:hypothetical protein